MFRHVVMFRWKPGTSPEAVAAVADGLGGLPAAIPVLRSFRFGPDAEINDGNFDFVVVADFDSSEDYLTYRDDPTHQAIVADRILPNLAERAAVQYFSD